MSVTNVSKPSTALTNTTKVSGAETWATITTTWASETRTWNDVQQLIENISSPQAQTIDVSSSFTSYTASAVIGGTYKGQSQSFTGDGKVLNSVSFKIGRRGSPEGQIFARIYAETHATAFGTDSLPTGTALAVSDAKNTESFSSNLEYVTFTFSGGNKILLSNGTNYVVTLEWAGSPTSSDTLNVGYGSGANGNNALKIGSSWTALSNDMNYILYTDTTAVTEISNLSKP